MDLQRNGIDSGDIRQLIYENVSSDAIEGITKTLNYWCHDWKGKRFPTPLNVVYCLDNLKMIVLPFLDTAIDQNKFWGLEIDNLLIYKKAISRVALHEASSVLRKCSYDTYQSWPGEGDPSCGIRLPTANEMRSITEHYRAIRGTVGFLREYGIDFDDWDYTAYWTQELEGSRSMGVSVFESDHVLIRQRATETRECQVRPVLNFFDGDGVFDYLGTLDKYGLPDKKSEKFAKKLAKK